jgi:hypothetical protein
LLAVFECHRGGDDCRLGSLLRRVREPLGVHLEAVRIGGATRAV